MASTLFVIIDPTRSKQPALVRAMDIAQQMGGHVHVFCSTYVADEDLGKFKSRADAKRQSLKKTQEKVDKLLEPLKKAKLSVSTEVIWNQGWYQAAVHASARKAADLIIKSTYSSDDSRHDVSSRGNIFLLRHSTCPVLLTNSGKSHTLGKVLAAVAIEKGNKQHSILNNRIVSAAKKITQASDAELHLVAALQTRLNLPKLLELHIEEDKIKKTEQELIAERFGVDPQFVHVQQGDAEDVIVSTAKKLKVQALVLGTRARKGLSGALLGNTAEKILGKLSTDVLIIS